MKISIDPGILYIQFKHDWFVLQAIGLSYLGGPKDGYHFSFPFLFFLEEGLRLISWWEGEIELLLFSHFIYFISISRGRQGMECGEVTRVVAVGCPHRSFCRDPNATAVDKIL